ncbi:hypothetical protein GCK32_008433 [Trichostrongylus colubriformis]|uniref:Uncharacterized protein n=1 Tax=Trichostrongylus colubriformis TaxID=6319 RepID=A0AAN8F398_TRICO
MSLLEFPPLNSTGKPYVLQEYNGRLLTGSSEEFRKMAKCDSMSDYPFVERAHLNSLQHSISKSDVADTYIFREADRLKQAMDRWEKDGITGIIDYVANITEDSKLWPISRLGRGVLRVRNGLASVAARVLPSMGQDRIEELLHQYSTTMNWKNNWLRCVAVHDEGRRLALCQNNDYIRVYNIGRSQKTPLTLKHPAQNNVACIAWEPFDQRVLAVAANNKILIWRLSVKATNIKPSVRCAQVIELPAMPINQIVWDRTTTNVLLAVSPNSSKIMIVNISSGEVDCFCAWTGGNITRIVPTLDGRRLAVLYTGNVIRVYDRNTWHEQRWSGMAGRATSAVCGFVEAPLYGHPSILFFLPKFTTGSLLAIVWSAGNLQYLPLLYGQNSSSHFNSRSILDEISDNSSPAHRTASDSLHSSELPSGCRDRSLEEDIVLFSERFRSSRSADLQRN